MAKPSGDRDSDHLRETVCDIFALLLFYFAATNLQGVQTAFPRGRGVPGYPLVGNNDGDGSWKDFDDAFAMTCASADLRIYPNIDPEGLYNVALVPAIQEPIENIDADNAAAAEADLNMWLLVAEVASLPRQIERDEANVLITRPQGPQVPSSVVESGVTPSSLVDYEVAGVPEHLPPQSLVPATVAADAPAPDVDVVGIFAGILPKRIGDEDEDEAHAEAQVEVEAFPPVMLEMSSAAARLPQFATASVAVPSGGLESNLEERMPVDLPEAGDSAADLPTEPNKQDDVENLEVGEPHAEGMQ